MPALILEIRWGHFTRTSNRHDYALSPSSETVLDILKSNALDVIGIGKISDIFNGQGITKSIHSTSSHEGMLQTMEEMKTDFTGLLFTNLVDFDAKWGHRRNVSGYGGGRRFTRGYAGTQHSSAHAPRLGGKPPPHPAHHSGLLALHPKARYTQSTGRSRSKRRTDLRPRKGRIAEHCGLSVCCGPSHPVSVHDR